MDNSIITHPKYSGLYKLVNSFCENMNKLNKEEVDSYLLFTMLFAYTSKYLKEQNIELTTENIYDFMERIWEDKSTRHQIVDYYIKSMPKQFQLKNNDD